MPHTGLYAHRPSILARSNTRAHSDSPTVMRWLNHDTILLASHSSDCFSSCCSRRLDEVTSFGVLQQPRSDLLCGDEALLFAIRLLDDAGDDRENVSLFPRRFHSRVTQAAEHLSSLFSLAD